MPVVEIGYKKTLMSVKNSFSQGPSIKVEDGLLHDYCVCVRKNPPVITWKHSNACYVCTVRLRRHLNWIQGLRPVSEIMLSLQTNLSSLITLATIVFPMLKITRWLKIFWETVPRSRFSVHQAGRRWYLVGLFHYFQYNYRICLVYYEDLVLPT